MLDTKIKQYKELKELRDGLNKRLEELNKQIKKELIVAGYNKNGIKAEVQLRSSVRYDKLKLEDILWRKGLWEKCTTRIIDENLVEQAYYNDELTDDDLREIRETIFTTALIVGDSDIQE